MNFSCKYNPSDERKRSCILGLKIEKEFSTEVWRSTLEQEELYHQQMERKGLTSAPI